MSGELWSARNMIKDETEMTKNFEVLITKCIDVITSSLLSKNSIYSDKQIKIAIDTLAAIFHGKSIEK